MTTSARLALSAFALVVGFVAAPGIAHASSPNGIYVYPSKVVFLPDQPNATSVVIHGAFFTWMLDGHYTVPKCGYMYFTCVKGQEAMCRLQWAEIANDVGKNSMLCWGFGAWQMVNKSTLRAEGAPLANPDTWDLAMGVAAGVSVDNTCPKAKGLVCPLAPPPDMLMIADMTKPVDMAMAKADLATVPDLATGKGDLASVADLSTGKGDLTMAPADISMAAVDMSMAAVDMSMAAVDMSMAALDMSMAEPDLAMAAADLTAPVADDLSMQAPADLAKSPKSDLSMAPGADLATPVIIVDGCSCAIGGGSRNRGGMALFFAGLIGLALLRRRRG
ncbi:MAG: hypothetical protein EXR72_16665 [Myxococcales bacterium]|nr:hypothetical protein [Myxococcales bacterium]